MSQSSMFISNLLEHPRVKYDNDMLTLLLELYDKACDDFDEGYQKEKALNGEKAAFHLFYKAQDWVGYFNYHKFEEIRKTFAAKE